MLPSYVERTRVDAAFYDAYLRPRMPDRLLDAHQHLCKREFLKGLDPNVRKADWASQCYDEMTLEDSEAFAELLFPGISFSRNALTVVGKGSDLLAANAYLAELLRQGKVPYAMMTLDPRWSDGEVEKMLVEGNFTGMKPYPDLATGQKASEISIFECMPHSKLQILNKHKKAMTLHIPRAGRLADSRNTDEIKRIHDQYPDIKMIVAHFGRCYAVDTFETGLELLGDYTKELTFDLAAVLNPDVLDMAFQAMDHEKILWGTDLPVFMWHGRRRWTRNQYFNLAREDFPWNRHEEDPETEAGYTFFLYEQMRNILDAIERAGEGRRLANAIFYQNATRILEQARKGE